MDDQTYLQYCQDLLAAYAGDLSARTAALAEEDPLRQLATGFTRLAGDRDYLYSDGASLVHRLFTHWPDFAPTFPRDLLWFLGGDCLHFMPDEEIQRFQQLDEMRAAANAAGETLNYADARAKLLKLQ